jgi:DNA (cytosine-5)-methyltransferase 1
MNKPTFIDLFAGAGGASTGLINAGFECVAAIEIDDWAADTYELNHSSTKVMRSDIKKVQDKEFEKFKGIDLIIGGPPCQGFSIAASNRRKKDDPRNHLYLHYVRTVEVIRPKFIIVENVKEIVKFKLENGELLLTDFTNRLEQIGYKLNWRMLNAKNFGVPQDRIRFFLVGSLKEKINLESIETHSEENNLFKLKPVISLEEAINDLPIPVRDIDEYSYNNKPLNDYQKKMREGSDKVYNHEPMRHTQRIIERFKHIPINGSILNAPSSHRNRTRGDVDVLSEKVYSQNHRRLNPKEPSKTITASFYSSFIHSYQDRNLTVREAARIQGFPDKFRFLGKRTTLSNKLLAKKGIHEDIHLDQFNQVGNAVSPIVAEVLGKLILKHLK